jgi:predicted DNA-binding transcriptional regulator AlpA
MPERIFRLVEVKPFYGNPSNSTFYDRIKRGLIPAPDVELGPQTPGWTEGLIERDQAAKRAAGRSGDVSAASARRVRLRKSASAEA